jgi:hypothetical protein
MHFLNFKSCPADPDMWMRPAIKSDGTKVWDFVLMYTDDTLVISKNAESILRNEMGKYFELKQESIGPPNIYLGGHLRQVKLKNAVDAWAFSYIIGDNQSVLANTTEPDSTLKKKSQSIAYHVVREGVAKDEWRTRYVNTHERRLVRREGDL